MEVTMARKRSAEVDSDTLIEAAEEVTGNKKRMVEVKVRDSSPPFPDADSDILLKAVEISLTRRSPSRSSSRTATRRQRCSSWRLARPSHRWRPKYG